MDLCLGKYLPVKVLGYSSAISLLQISAQPLEQYNYTIFRPVIKRKNARRTCKSKLAGSNGPLFKDYPYDIIAGDVQKQSADKDESGVSDNLLHLVI